MSDASSTSRLRIGFGWALIVLGLVNVNRWGWWTPRQDVEVVGVKKRGKGGGRTEGTYYLSQVT